MSDPNDQDRQAAMLREQRVRRVMMRSPWLQDIPFPPLPPPLPPAPHPPPLPPSESLHQLAPTYALEPPLPPGRPPIRHPSQQTPQCRPEHPTQSPSGSNRHMPATAPAAVRERRLATPPRELAASSGASRVQTPIFPPLPPPLPPSPRPPPTPSVLLQDLASAYALEPPLPSGKPITHRPRKTPRRRLPCATTSPSGSNRRELATAPPAVRERRLATPPRQLAASSTAASPVFFLPLWIQLVSTPPPQVALSRPQSSQSPDDQLGHFMPPLPPTPRPSSSPALVDLMPPPPPRPRPTPSKPPVKSEADSTTDDCFQGTGKCSEDCFRCLRRRLRNQGTRLS